MLSPSRWRCALAHVNATSERPLRLSAEPGRIEQVELEEIVRHLVHQVEAGLAGAGTLGVRPQHEQSRERAVGQRALRTGGRRQEKAASVLDGASPARRPSRAAPHWDKETKDVQRTTEEWLVTREQLEAVAGTLGDKPRLEVGNGPEDMEHELTGGR